MEILTFSSIKDNLDNGQFFLFASNSLLYDDGGISIKGEAYKPDMFKQSVQADLLIIKLL